MADMAVASSTSLDMLMQLGDAPIMAAETIAQDLSKESFAQVIEQSDVPEMVLQVPELIQENELEALVGLIEVPVPTEPVLKVLSKELSPEDLKLYVGQDLFQSEQPAENLKLQVRQNVFQPEQPKDDVQISQVTEKIVVELGQQAVVTKDNNNKLVHELQEPKKQVQPKVEHVEKEMAKNVVAKVETQLDIEHPVVVVEELENIKFTVEEKPLKEKTVDQPVELEEVFTELSQKDPAPVKTEAPVTMTRAAMQARAPQVARDLAIQMKHAVDHQMDKITVQLNPPSLGKVEIELQFNKDGRVNAILYAEKLDTYELLQRTPHLLKDALSGAGINPDATSFSFNYRGDESAGQDFGSQIQQSRSGRSDGSSEISVEATNYRQAPKASSEKKVDIHA